MEWGPLFNHRDAIHCVVAYAVKLKSFEASQIHNHAWSCLLSNQTMDMVSHWMET